MTTGHVRFRFRAATPDGRIESGRMEARNRESAERELEERGLLPIRLEERSRLEWRRPVPTSDLAVLFRNVATLVETGVPIERAFEVSESLVSRRLATAVSEVRRLVREGEPVGAALASRPDVFPRGVAGIIRAGERGSALARASTDTADQLEAEAELRSRIRSSLAYPILILLMGVATIGVLGGVVVPRFAVVLGDLGAELPRSTQLLMSASAAFQKSWLPALLATVAALPLFRAALANPSVQQMMDRWLLRLPLIGGLRKGFSSARTCRALGSMLGNGMPLLAAMDETGEAIGDTEISARLARARIAVARGVPLTEALRNESVLTRAALQLVAIGESSSRMAVMVLRAGDVAAEQAQRALRTTISLLEPVLIVLLGALVAAAAGALLQAVYSVRPI